MIDLTKTIEPGTWRWIGQRVAGLTTLDVPIGGTSILSIAMRTGGVPSRIGRINPRNAFVIEKPPLRLLYVRPRYRGYRYAAGKVFSETAWQVDFDYALGKELAAAHGFQYVLLLRIPPSVNRSHGRFERPGDAVPTRRLKACYADQRILYKWIGRPSRYFRHRTSLNGYRPNNREAIGMTLKQLGKWGFAMGVDDDTTKCLVLTPIQ